MKGEQGLSAWQSSLSHGLHQAGAAWQVHAQAGWEGPRSPPSGFSLIGWSAVSSC